MSPPETPNDGQLELIHLDRSPPSSVAVLLRLPEANARSFVVASALGRFFDHDGSFKEVRSLKEIGGSFVGPRQRQRVLQALGIKERRWQDSSRTGRAAMWPIAAGLVVLPCSPNRS